MESGFIEIYAGTIWQVEMLKSLLENAEVDVFLKDEFLGTISPWWASPGGAGSVKVLVPISELEKAKQVLDDYENNMKE